MEHVLVKTLAFKYANSGSKIDFFCPEVICVNFHAFPYTHLPHKRTCNTESRGIQCFKESNQALTRICYYMYKMMPNYLVQPETRIR